MVEYNPSIDDKFAALADPTRRDIIERLRDIQLSVNEIALEYDISIAAISKHLTLLADAGLVAKRRQGKFVMVHTNLQALAEVEAYLAQLRGEQS